MAKIDHTLNVFDINNQSSGNLRNAVESKANNEGLSTPIYNIQTSQIKTATSKVFNNSFFQIN